MSLDVTDKELAEAGIRCRLWIAHPKNGSVVCIYCGEFRYQHVQAALGNGIPPPVNRGTSTAQVGNG